MTEIRSGVLAPPPRSTARRAALRKRNTKSSRRANSFVVRVWREPGDDDGREAPIRGYLRNLRTGEEHFLNDATQIVDFLLQDTGAPANRAAGAQKAISPH